MDPYEGDWTYTEERGIQRQSSKTSEDAGLEDRNGAAADQGKLATYGSWRQ